MVFARRTIIYFGIVIFVFFGLRLLVVSSFPIFNDEGIYLQYSQLIHDNFSANKFISVHNQFHDWKPPLQYWLGSLFVNLGSNPLLAGRIFTIAFSFLGFVGIYLFTKEIFGSVAAIAAIFFYALCPAVLFFNDQFIAESFLFSLAPWLYWCVLRFSQWKRPMWGYVVGAFAVALILLLIKQSGLVFVILSFFITFIFKSEKTDQKPFSAWRPCFILGSITLGAILAEHLIIPGEFWADAANFGSRWVLTIGEVIKLPWNIWYSNIGIVWDFYVHLYTIIVVALLICFCFVVFKFKDRRDIVILLMFLTGSAIIAGGLRSFNDYIYNTAVITLLIVIIGRLASLALNFRKSSVTTFIILALIIILAVNWSYQILFMKISPGNYLLTRTNWMRISYVEGWSTGFGIPEIIAMLKQLPGPGIVYLDPQWGNPRTSLKVFGGQYPWLQITPLTTQFLTPQGTLAIKAATAKYATRLVIFSSSSRDIEQRKQWQKNILQLLCNEKQEIKPQQGQMPIIVCQF